MELGGQAVNGKVKSRDLTSPPTMLVVALQH